MFAGTHTAIITPFREGRVDESAFRQLIEKQVAGGVQGIVPVGTTGESPTLDADEHLEVIRIAVDAAAGRVKVIAGTGANSTSEAIHLTEEAEALGADASLQVTPYYNKPSQEGLYHHFRAVAESSSLPIMLYSVPGRSVVEIAPETAARLANDCETVVSIKEAGGNVERVDALKAALPDGFEILSGDDPLTIEFMKRGACGVVSVASNIVPDKVSALVNAMLAGDVAGAEAIQEEYFDLLSTLMSVETNPMPIKAAAALMGLCSDEIRLPMLPLEGEKLEHVRSLLQKYSLV
ncbi:4-hydroxy-tetrahydrodipicolinate synthase [Rubritalea tangerina]|uniref:4-hydroxy-tetrahydrodipicolinate synthase n=1 Tax=Rubritalea tangerina TaxID=430798 RepID=A0ABW4Z7B3_9BACT